MLSGHFATALVAHRKLPKSSLLFFLIVCNLQDFLWFLFHYLGLEPTTPKNVFAVSMQDLTVNMLYSHDLIPQFIWTFLVFIIGKAIFKQNKVALVGALLFAGHAILDAISGFPHYVFGPDSHQIGFGLYHANIYLALLIEFVFTGLLLLYFFKQEKILNITRTKSNMTALIGILAFGIGFILLVAKRSIGDMLGLPDMSLPINTTVLLLSLTYASMTYGLHYFTKQYDVIK